MFIFVLLRLLLNIHVRIMIFRGPSGLKAKSNSIKIQKPPQQHSLAIKDPTVNNSKTAAFIKRI